ncbi:MAG: transposase family protein [Clostridiales Family XIII bacterium]|jgi:transposase|nr:transposase family protein [Clostridiales Family XIII bacterium]
MDSPVKTADPNFEYIRHETEDGVMRVFVKSTRQEARCPYCGVISGKVHSIYFRKFRDLPIQDKKVEIVIDNRKFFCLNPDCSHKTFAESFECLPKMGRRSRRLTEAIMDTATNLSSVAASKTLKQRTADVGKSTICRLLKKGLQNRQDKHWENPH